MPKTECIGAWSYDTFDKFKCRNYAWKTLQETEKAHVSIFIQLLSIKNVDDSKSYVKNGISLTNID